MVKEVKGVVLSLALELAKLGEAIMNHDDGKVLLLLCEWDENRAIFLLGPVELAVDPDSGVLALTNLTVVVNEEANVPCGG